VDSTCTRTRSRPACGLAGAAANAQQHVQTFRTTAGDLVVLRDWLAAHEVTHVAMESTGVYWKPVYYALESDFTCLLVNAAHIKQLPGRKTDVKDCAWIAQLLEHGLLRGSFVPPAPIRELRDLTGPVLFRPYLISRAAALPVASRLRDRR
jgi:transposase